MPVFIAQAIRTAIIFLLQSGFVVAAQAMLSPLIDTAKAAVRRAFGLSEEDSLSYVANFVLDVVELAGLSVLAFKSRLPLQIADKLGFTTKGFLRRALPAKVSTGSSAPGSVAKLAGGKRVIPTATEVAVLAPVVKAAGKGFSKGVSFLEGKLNSVFLGFLVAGSFIDFGNWETGAYSDTFQKVFQTVSLGLLKPDEDFRQTKTASPEVFTKVYETYKTAGAVAINDPFKQQSVPFTRDNLIDLIDKVGAQSLLATGGARTKDILAASQMMMVFNFPNTQTPAALAGSGTTQDGVQNVSVEQTPRVFTGIVSQGVVSQGLVFTPRPDDLIESVGELRSAAANNLSAYLSTLLGKIVYEVKVVPSVVTKDGFKQTGTTQRIQSGTYAGGAPKYKTVTNKFAVVAIYAVTDKGTRTKLTQITLGPTDAARLLVTQNDLRALEVALPQLLVASGSAKTKKAEASDLSSLGLESDGVVLTQKDVDGWPVAKFQRIDDDGRYVYEHTYETFGQTVTSNVTAKNLMEAWQVWGRGQGYTTKSIAGLSPEVLDSGAFVDPALPPEITEKKKRDRGLVPKVPELGAGASASVPAGSSGGLGADAATLSEWYQARGLSLPSVQERATLYQSLALGQAAYYTGTAEQNTKLLNALKAQ